MKICGSSRTGGTMSYSRAVVCLLVCGGAAAAQQYVVSTVAGGAPPPTPVTASNAFVGLPLSVATDASGNAYFAASYCLFRLDPSGVMTRVAGNGKPGYSG